MSVPSDPQFKLAPPDGDQSFAAAMEMATAIFAGESLPATDVTSGARYYANLHEIKENDWFYRNIVLDSANHPITAQILHHTFFA
jgi:hypothetical protein